MTQKEKLTDLLTDSLPHCDNPLQNIYDEIVERLAEHLIKNGIVISPYNIGDTIYYITGIHNRLIKKAKIEEIYFSNDGFAFYVCTDNCVKFTLQENEVFSSRADAEREIMKEVDNSVI